MSGISVLGRKGDMTQVYDEHGRAFPATAVDVSDCVVVTLRGVGRHGYEALQLGLGRANPRRVSRPLAGHCRKAGIEPVAFLREVRVSSSAEYRPGQKLGPEVFAAGDKVDVTGVTKGRGFAGGVKRWGWHGGSATHGSMTHRRVGSAGAGTTPGRVLPGRTMAGHYGVERVTIRKLQIVKVEQDKGLVYISGAIPGHRGSIVVVRKRA
ncbi:MAG: 50S ribosomal protein L3 [bacterium]